MDHSGSYLRFGLMITTSAIVMFGLMYLNTYALPHVHWSETRFYMTLIMAASMAIVMLAFMLNMYQDSRKNLAIFVGSGLLFVTALLLVRSQATVSDQSYMRAMIPHHSIAVMTSERSNSRDPRVRKLAQDIIVAQRREIAEMRYLIEDISENGPRPTEKVQEQAQ